MVDPPSLPDDLLVGRDPELEAFDHALASAAGGRGRLLLVVGEPGIGKTRLADAFEARASARGFSVHWGRVAETGGAPCYWPWTQILGSIAAEPGLEGAAGAGSPLAPILPGAPLAMVGDAAQARFRMLEGVTALLRAAGRRAPRAIVLDDVHAADGSSLELLQFVSRALRGLPVVLLVTYRDVEARQSPGVRDMLSRTARDGTVLALRRLGADEVAQLVVRRLTGVQAGIVEAVQRVTEGNPLFVGEVVRQLAADPVALRTGDLEKLPVTDGIRLVIGDRIALLPVAARDLVETASVLGREVRLEILAGVMGLPLADVRAQLTHLVAADLLAERQEGRFEFRHLLFREVPYQQLPPGRRAELHLAAARTLAVTTGPRHLAEVAHHLLAAREVADAAAVVRAVLDAARAAVTVLAHEEAVRWLDRGLAVLVDRPEQESLRGALQAARAEALALSGDLLGAQQAATAAAAIARSSRDPDLLCRAAIAYGLAFEPGVVDEARVALLQEALDAAGPAESSLRARLLARLAAALQPSATPEEPIAMALEAVAMARRTADPATLAAVLRSAASAMADTADPAERMPIDIELAEVAKHCGEPVLELQARVFLFLDHLEAGDVALARLRLAECRLLADALGQPRYRWRMPLLEASIALLEGRFAEVERLQDEAQVLVAEVAERRAVTTLALQRNQRFLLQGRREEASRALAAAFESGGAPVSVASTAASAKLAQCAARIGDVSETRARLAPLPETALSHGDPVLSQLLTEALAVARDPRLAQVSARLAPLRRRLVTWGMIGLYMDLPGAAIEGRAAHALGLREECLLRFEEAIEMVVSMRASALETWIRLWFGQALAAFGDAERARTELARAIALAAELGIQTVPGLAGSALEARSVAPPAPARSPAPAILEAPAFELRRSGDAWALSRAGREIHLKDLRGLQILARLVAEPGREIHGTELVAPEAGTADLGDAGELLDREAKAAYRRRLEDLREDLEEAEGHNDVGRAERVRTEMEALTRELSRAVGLGGRDRRAGAAAERARTAVQRRVREAVRRIADHDPELGRHLEWAVRTGAFCSYDPGGRR